MHNKVMIGAVAAVLGLGLSVAQAQVSDVVVDLSVLDNLSPALSSGVSAQPLFPVVQKSTSKKVSAIKKKNKSVKKAKSARKASVVQTAKKEPKQPVENKVVAEEPKTEPAALAGISREILPEPQSVTVAGEETRQIVPEEKEVATAPVSETGSISVAETPAEVSAPLVKDAETSTVVAEDGRENEKIVVVDVEPISPVRVVDAEPVKEAEPQISNLLVFADDAAELTTVQQEQIDKIIASFENPQQNKIGIFSYNLNDGVDAFKRKRQSLNRAVEVRSYLLPKGYKNFSIKVVNVDSGSDKANSVEILELK